MDTVEGLKVSETRRNSGAQDFNFGVRSSKGFLPNSQPQAVHYLLEKWIFGHCISRRASLLSVSIWFALMGSLRDTCDWSAFVRFGHLFIGARDIARCKFEPERQGAISPARAFQISGLLQPWGECHESVAPSRCHSEGEIPFVVGLGAFVQDLLHFGRIRSKLKSCV